MSDPRTLTCTTCGSDVEVYEEPVHFIDPERFRCGPCLDGREAQLALVPGDEPREPETRPYDPAIAELPY